MAPVSVENDWDRLYREFPEVYDEFTNFPYEPTWIEVVNDRFGFEGKAVLDIGSGTGKSTFELAPLAGHVVGVEPNPAMLAVAEANPKAKASNVAFIAGSGQAIPLPDASVDVVAGATPVFWPARDVIPRFVAETERVLRPHGLVVIVNTAPGNYGGELNRVIDRDVDEYEREIEDILVGECGFSSFDYESEQNFGSTENLVRTYGFIFGRRAIDHATAAHKSTIRYRWRVYHRLAATDR